MAKQATFEIVINGVKESIAAVDSLNKSLDALEKRIDALAKKNVNVSTSGGDTTARTKALEEEDRLLRQIDQLHQKVADTERQEYQELLHAKDELKEYQTIAKSIAAQTNLDQGINDTNTMQGMKAQLHDIKAAMQTLDVDSDKFKQLQQDANDLNNKLKEIEQGYGVFSRSVGNYANGVAEGISKYKVQIGDTVREFDSAKQAAKELSNELLNLPKGADGAQELRKAIQSIKSDIKDLSASSSMMDNLLDTMQSFTAIGSVAEGFSALFGFDNDELEKSIQKLVALQNVMQGLEQIQQQMNTGEGIGGWLAKGNQLIDSFVAKVTGASKAQKALNADMKAGKAAAEGLAAGQTAATTATKAATVATKAFSASLKAIGIGLVISLVASLVSNWRDLWKYLTDTVPVLKDLGKWFGTIEKVVMGVGSVLMNFLLQPLGTLIKAIQDVISGNFSQAWEDIKDGFKQTFSVAQNYHKGYTKAVENQQERHNKKLKKLNDEQLADENAKYGESHRRTQEYLRKQLALTKQGTEEYKELQRRLWEDERREREENQKQALKDAKEAARLEKEVLEAQANTIEKINSLKLELLQDGLAKELAQLNANNEKEIAEIKKNAKKIGRALTEEHLKAQEEVYKASKQKIFENYWDETFQIITDNSIKDFENKVDEIENETKDLERTVVGFNKAISEVDLAEVVSEITDWSDEQVNMFKEFYGSFGQNLEQSFEERLKRVDVYANEYINKLNEKIREAEAERLNVLNEQEQKELDVIRKQIFSINEEAKKSIGVDFDATPGYRKYFETIRDENRDTYSDMEKQGIEYVNRMDALNNQLILKTQEYENKRRSLSQETNEKLRNNNQLYYNKELDALNDFFKEAQSLADKQPVYKDGFINIKASKNNYNEALETMDAIIKEIGKKRKLLYFQEKNGIISPETYTNTLASLFSLEEAVKKSKERVQKDIKQLLPNLLKQIEDVFQILGQAATQVIQSIGEINQAAFEKQMEDLDKQSEALEEQLEKQKELTQKYADDVDSIEDELSSSRGDRRQFLIDQLNAQMAAERESLAQEKRIEKEQERLDKKRQDLEYQNEMRQWEQSKITAALNAALAISNAAVNKWPIPAVAMIAAATAVGAAQMAAVAAAKPKKYAEGGLLQGKSHAQGGIKTMGGKVELEGDEFVVNKKTTMQNLPLMHFINSKKKKIDINDMFDFYSSGIKKNISIPNKTKFADGGVIPTLRSDVDLEGNVLRAIERYNERNIVVSVVDIINKSESVRQVQTLAGIK